MGTIQPRKKKDGNTSYTATVRIKQNGVIVHSETRTFSRKQAAQAWIRDRESELERDGLPKPGMTLSDAIARYISEREQVELIRKTKLNVLHYLSRTALGGMTLDQITAPVIVGHARDRRAAGATASTVQQDIIWLRLVLRYAAALWDVQIDHAGIDKASVILRQERLTGSANKRTRRPTADELQRLYDYFDSRSGHAQIPMSDIVRFAIASTRRCDEITRLEWATLGDKTVLVPAVKHPKLKTGNDKRARLTPEAMEIIKRQPRTDARIFPYHSKSIGAAFRRACKFLGIEDLHFHDLRREGVSRLFESGYSVQQVQLFSLHESWAALSIYTKLRPEDVPDR